MSSEGTYEVLCSLRALEFSTVIHSIGFRLVAASKARRMERSNTKLSHGKKAAPYIPCQKQVIYWALPKITSSSSRPKRHFPNQNCFSPRRKLRCYKCNSLDHLLNLLKEFKNPCRLIWNVNRISKDISRKA